MKRQQGFSLIELMIAAGIVALIAAFAYPSYIEQLRKTRRADCSGALVSLASAMERHQTMNNTYLGAAAGGSNTGAPAVFPTTCPVDGGTATYNLTIAAATASTFRIEAAPTGAQSGDNCGTFTLTSTGVKDIKDAAAGKTWQDCWR